MSAIDVDLPEENGTVWSVLVQDIDSGEVLRQHDPETVQDTASVGKVFLLHRLLAEVDAGTRTLEDRVTRRPVEAIEDHDRLRVFRATAEQAWLKVVAADPTRPYPADFVDGFEDGFVDYLDAGGPGDPPAVPPWRYRRRKYETLEGRQAILAWQAGFRYGAAVGIPGDRLGC